MPYQVKMGPLIILAQTATEALAIFGASTRCWTDVFDLAIPIVGWSADFTGKPSLCRVTHRVPSVMIDVSPHGSGHPSVMRTPVALPSRKGARHVIAAGNAIESRAVR
jgi:hypothetical protein